MLQRPNVELITEAVTGLTADGVTTQDGTHRRVDCIIWATGFRTNDFMLPMEVRGAGGVTLADYWGGAPRAHLGITGTAWTQCQSWYRKDHDGRIVANWPGYMCQYLQRTVVLDPSQYRVVTTDNVRAVAPGHNGTRPT